MKIERLYNWNFTSEEIFSEDRIFQWQHPYFRHSVRNPNMTVTNIIKSINLVDNRVNGYISILIDILGNN